MENTKNQAMNDEQMEQIVGGAVFAALDEVTPESKARFIYEMLSFDALTPEMAQIFAAADITREKYLAMDDEEKMQLLENVKKKYALSTLAQSHAIKEFL